MPGRNVRSTDTLAQQPPWPIVFTVSCGRCGHAARLAFVDTELVGPDTGIGAAWVCPTCEGANRLPVVGMVISALPA